MTVLLHLGQPLEKLSNVAAEQSPSAPMDQPESRFLCTEMKQMYRTG